MKKYGLTERLSVLAALYPQLNIGRVLSQEKGYYKIATDHGEKLAEVSGKFRFNAVTTSDFPAVGDFVMVDWNEVGGIAIIHYVLPRNSCFTRRAAGESRVEQVVAANIKATFWIEGKFRTCKYK